MEIQIKIIKVSLKRSLHPNRFKRKRQAAMDSKEVRAYVQQLESTVLLLEREADFFAGAALSLSDEDLPSYVKANSFPKAPVIIGSSLEEIMCRNVTVL